MSWCLRRRYLNFVTIIIIIIFVQLHLNFLNNHRKVLTSSSSSCPYTSSLSSRIVPWNGCHSDPCAIKLFDQTDTSGSAAPVSLQPPPHPWRTDWTPGGWGRTSPWLETSSTLIVTLCYVFWTCPHSVICLQMSQCVRQLPRTCDSVWRFHCVICLKQLIITTLSV